MKQYDKIYVPHDPKMHGVYMDDNYRVSHEGFVGPTGHPVEVFPMHGVIVLTLEELKDVWESASAMPDLPGVLELYLKSKGIEL